MSAVSVAAYVAAALLGWTTLAWALAPVVGAHLAGRRMNHHERQAFQWGALAIFIVLFLTALLTIGTHQS